MAIFDSELLVFQRLSVNPLRFFSAMFFEFEDPPSMLRPVAEIRNVATIWLFNIAMENHYF